MGNPNPSLQLIVNDQGLAPAPAGGGNVPLVIGWTQSGSFSGAPGNGPLAVSNLQTLTTEFGSYGNAVDAAAIDLAVGASEVLVYKAFGGSIAASAYATLTVPSTTGGDGIILTANEPGTGGNAITFHLIVSGGGSSAVISGTSTAIVATCGSACTNTTLISAINTAAPAATATLLAGGSDDVVAFALTNLSGGAGGHTGTGTGEVTVTGDPMAPFGTPTGTGSTGIIIQITESSNGSIYGQFNYSLDGGVTYSAAQNIVPTTPQTLGTTNCSAVFTGADTAGVWVANDTYTNPITASTGQMYPYGVANFAAALKQITATGSFAVVGEGTFTAAAAANPLDNFSVVIEITKSGTYAAGSAQYIYSLDGGNTFSANQTMPDGSGNITLPGGVVLTPADTGGPGGSIAGFQAGEQYLFGTLGPQLTEAKVLAIIESLIGNINTWGWIHVAQQCNTVTASASSGFCLNTLFSDVETAVAAVFASGQYVGAWVLIDSPTDTTAANIDSTLEAWAAGVAGVFTTVGVGGNEALVSPANGWQLQRGSAFAVSAKASVSPIGQDLAWVGSGPLVGVSKLYRNETNTPGLGPAGFAPLGTIPGVNGFFIINANLLVSSSNDISLAQYRRVINAACQAARGALVQFLSAGVRLTPTGKIDPRDIAIIENVTNSAVLSAINGQASGASTSVSNTLGAGGELFVTVAVQPLGYAKQISVTVGFVNPALSAQAA
jgi:hypothetical protein